ncbi:alpha/beta fold hydrolase [Hamadaea tsunoensis]|uniref:alpha/beta fold hydrolase n=1 Tax=Hamadaea tsunoensis TaxID=53368 RepID=UPI00041ABC71|nr:alpha/beta hydrolase [Hamadaea tsunoensis]
MTELIVEGARIHYQVTGAGPVLLISQSGEGDADRSVDLVRSLAGEFTVVTYDRRGLSRSVVTDPGLPITLRRHAADAAAVVRAVTDKPVLMLGLSLGAAVGLHMLHAYAGTVRTLIAHEPIAVRFLAADQERIARDKLASVRVAYETGGWRAAAGRVAAVLGIDPRDQATEPGVTAFPFTDQRAANFEFFLTADLDAALADTLTPADVARDAPVIPAVGERSPADGFDYLAGLALADRLGRPAESFPGGHNGNLTHPRAFAERVRELLAV